MQFNLLVSLLQVKMIQGFCYGNLKLVLLLLHIYIGQEILQDKIYILFMVQIQVILIWLLMKNKMRQVGIILKYQVNLDSQEYQEKLEVTFGITICQDGNGMEILMVL